MSASTHLKALRKKFRRATAQHMAAGTALMNVGLLTRDGKVEMRRRLKDAGRRCNKRPGEPEEDTERRVIEATEHLRKWTGQLLDRLPMDTADEMFATLSADPDRSEVLDAEWIDVEESVEDPEAPPLASESTEAPQSVAVALVGDANALTVSLTRDQRLEFILALLLPMSGTLETKRQCLAEAVDEGLLLPMAVPSVSTLSRHLKSAVAEGEYPGVGELTEFVTSVGSRHSSDAATRGYLLLSAAYHGAFISRAVTDGVVPHRELANATALLRRSRLCLYAPLEDVKATIVELSDERTQLLAKIFRSTKVGFWPDLPGVKFQLTDPSVRSTSSQNETDIYPSGTHFADIAKDVLQLDYADRLPGGEVSDDVARIRAMIVEPVIDKEISAAAQADLWSGKIQTALSTSGVDELERFPRELYRRWVHLNERTVRSWRNKVVDAQNRAEKAGDPVPSAVEVLRHSYPKDRKPTQLKRTPAFVKRVKEIHLRPERVSATTVGRILRPEFDASDRTIQRTVAELLDKEQVEARAGPEADQMVFAPRLIRYTAKPNGVWIIDSTYISSELLQVNKEGSDPFLDLEITAAVEKVSEKGYVERRPVTHVYATLVIDARTGLWLSLRLWDKPVGARTAVLTLYDAMMRHGIPDHLYSDNGSEFANKEMARVLRLAGVNDVFSMPYEPRGRGRVEQAFRHLKDQVLAGLSGYRGRGGPEVPLKQLKTLPELERLLWAEIETYVNGQAMRGMPKSITRRAHYEEEIGARAIRTPDSLGGLALQLMYRRDDAKLHDTGLYVLGLRYWAAELAEIINGAKVVVFFDPYRPLVIHVAVQHYDGSLRYVCAAVQYGMNNPPPTRREQQEMIAESRRRIAAGARGSRDCAPLIGKSGGDALPADPEHEREPLLPSPESQSALPGGRPLIGAGDDSGELVEDDPEASPAPTTAIKPRHKRSKRTRRKVRLPFDD